MMMVLQACFADALWPASIANDNGPADVAARAWFKAEVARQMARGLDQYDAEQTALILWCALNTPENRSFAARLAQMQEPA